LFDIFHAVFDTSETCVNEREQFHSRRTVLVFK